MKNLTESEIALLNWTLNRVTKTERDPAQEVTQEEIEMLRSGKSDDTVTFSLPESISSILEKLP